jgi:hypothetical protein
MDKPKSKIPRAVSRSAGVLARRANAKLRGSEAAKIRSAKAVAARRVKRAERKAAEAET